MSGLAQGFQKALIAQDRGDNGNVDSNGSLDTGQELADWMDSATGWHNKRKVTFFLVALGPNLTTTHLSQMLAG